MTHKALRAAFSLLLLASTVNDIRRKLHMVKTHSTVEKQAKRMPDATVETTETLCHTDRESKVMG